MSQFDDVKALHSMGYAQQLYRGLGLFSNFAISFSLICILAGGITSYPVALAAGGGFSATIGWVIGGLFALIVAASLAQIASAYPTAGALYHWSSILGGRAWGWVTAWINLVGLIFVLASVDVGAYLLFKGLIAGPLLQSHVADWGYAHQTFAVLLILFTQALFNHFGIGITRKLTDASGYIVLVVSVLLAAVFIFYGYQGDSFKTIDFVNNTGSASSNFIPGPRSALIAFLIGLLYPIYTMTGFDASAHTSEETVSAQIVVPRGIILSVLISLIFGFFLAWSFVMATPNLVASAQSGGDAWFNLFVGLKAPSQLKSFLAILIVLANYLCGLAAVTSTSRMIFAFARDGGLPASKLLATVSRRYRTPVCAIWATSLLGWAATLYSPAFAALAAGSALFLYVSYAMPVASGLFAEGKKWTTFGPFRLGIFSRPFAVIAVVGVFVLAYAGFQPPNDIVINYAAGLTLLLGILWFGIERRRFKGPPIGREISERAVEIARLEKDL